MDPADTIRTNRAGIGASKRYQRATEGTKVMAKQQPTPGPWHCEEEFDGGGTSTGCWQIFSDSRHVAVTGQDDARLIAAAPDMLEILRAIDLGNGMFTSDMLRAVRAAIAKATGA